MLALRVLPVLQLPPALLPQHIAFTLCCFTFSKSTFVNSSEICWHCLSPQLLFTSSCVSPAETQLASAVLQIIVNLFLAFSTFKFAFFSFDFFIHFQKHKGEMLTLNIHVHIRIIPLKLFITLWIYFLILLQNKQISKILELMIAFSLTFSPYAVWKKSLIIEFSGNKSPTICRTELTTKSKVQR